MPAQQWLKSVGFYLCEIEGGGFTCQTICLDLHSILVVEDGTNYPGDLVNIKDTLNDGSTNYGENYVRFKSARQHQVVASINVQIELRKMFCV